MKKGVEFTRFAIMLAAAVILTSALASAGFFQEALGGKSALGSGLDFLFGTQNITTASGQQFLVFVAIFVIVFVAAADIVSTFSTFSAMTSWIIGFALAIITSATGLLSQLSLVVFSFVAGVGVIAIAGVIISAFVVAFAVHFGISGLSGWLKARKTMMEAETGAVKAAAGIRALKAIEKEAAR